MTYAKNTSIRNILGNVAFRIDSIIVFQQLGATNLAIYTIATILPEQIKTSFKNITTLLVPKYALHDNMDNIKKSMFRRSMQLLLLTILVTILYIIFAPLIYTLLFPKYHEAIVLTQLISLSFPAMIALIPLSALQAHTEEKKLNKLNTYTSVLMIMLTTVLTITHGLMGAIFAKILSRYINVAFTYFYLWQK
jgi:O-antigen/teichoic acid export membrane protein